MGFELVLVDSGGWVGAALLTGAYAFISWRPSAEQPTLYQALSFVGCALLVVNTCWHHAWPSAVTNLIWGSTAIVFFSRSQLRRSRTSRGAKTERSTPTSLLGRN